MVGGVAFAWTKPQDPPKLEDIPSVAELKAKVMEQPRDEPAIRLVWTAPCEARVNRAVPYSLTVTNTGTQAVQKVVVQVRLPNDANPSDTEPAVCAAGGVLLWELDTMQPREEKLLKMKLTSKVRGELAPRAWVTFTGSSAISVAVKEPKLTIALDAPETVQIGEDFRVKYRVTNDGDCTAERVLLTLDAPKELVRAGDSGEVMDDLAPARSHNGELKQRAMASGVYTYTVTTSCVDGQKVTAATHVRVLAPKLEVRIEGPAEVGMMRTAKYVATVTNTGDLVAEDVGLRFEPGEGIVPASATATLYSPAVGDPLAAAVGSLKPGEAKAFVFGGTAGKPGDYMTKVTASEKRGLVAAVEHRTVVKGIPGIRMELVDSVDPVKKGEETVYEIKISNTGTATDRNLLLRCELPAGTTLVSASGPVDHRLRFGVDFNQPGQPSKENSVTFEPVRELGPKTDISFKVKVKSGSVGNGNFKATITSEHITTPVTKEESTTVYGE